MPRNKRLPGRTKKNYGRELNKRHRGLHTLRRPSTISETGLPGVDHYPPSHHGHAPHERHRAHVHVERESGLRGPEGLVIAEPHLRTPRDGRGHVRREEAAADARELHRGGVPERDVQRRDAVVRVLARLLVY